MNRLLIAGAAVGVLAVPATGSGHPATIACGPEGPVVDAPTYRGATSSTVIENGVATITWTDGHVLRLPVPEGCVAPTPPGPTPAPTPLPPEVTPPAPPAAPPTCADLVARYPGAGRARLIAWGCATPNPPTTRVTRSVRVIRVVACVLGPRPARSYSVRRIRVVWTRGGEVIRVKTSTVRVEGRRCVYPRVTG